MHQAIRPAILALASARASRYASTSLLTASLSAATRMVTAVANSIAARRAMARIGETAIKSLATNASSQVMAGLLAVSKPVTCHTDRRVDRGEMPRNLGNSCPRCFHGIGLGLGITMSSALVAITQSIVTAETREMSLLKCRQMIDEVRNLLEDARG